VAWCCTGGITLIPPFPQGFTRTVTFQLQRLPACDARAFASPTVQNQHSSEDSEPTCFCLLIRAHPPQKGYFPLPNRIADESDPTNGWVQSLNRSWITETADSQQKD